MGYGGWSTNVYSAAASMRAAAGIDPFAYSVLGATKVHKDLDPKDVKIRESRDSDEHPESTAISVILDVTGSMIDIPRQVQAKLAGLFGLLLRKGYVVDPQILFGAIGDAFTDHAPTQFAQFESDNRLDDQLGLILLEGNGGGQKHESYELALYFMARHTSIDCFEKRGKKGYLFIVGDEMAYPRVLARQVAQLIGDKLEGDIELADIVAEASRTWDIYFIQPTSGSSYNADPEVKRFWNRLLGENVLQLDNPDAVCEVIALAIGMREGTIDLDQGIQDLLELGMDSEAARKALVPLGASRGAVATSTVPGDLDSADGGADRI